MTKRIMRAFSLDEISAVDRPAQAHAKKTLIKRDFSQDERDKAAESGAAMPDGSFPIKTTEDLKNAIHAIGRAKDPEKARAHIVSRAKSLGAADLLPEGWVSKSAGPAGSSMEVDMTKEEIDAMIAAGVQKALAEMTKAKTPPKASDGEPDGDEPEMGDEETKKAWRSYVEKRVAAARAEGADIAKRDEVFEANGATIRKSEVGDGVFAFIKQQHETIELASFEKRAKSELPLLPGTDIAKAKVLKALSGLGEETRKSLEAMLVAGNEAMNGMTKSLGHAGRAFSKAAEELDSLVDAHASEKGVTKSAAYVAVLATPKGRELYERSEKEKATAA